MAKKSNPAGAYYYAGGEKIELTPADDLFAVEGDAMEGVAASVGRALTDGLRLVTKDELGPAAASVSRSKPTYPVFRSHGATLVVLPEVRVEESRKSHWAKIDKWL